MADSRNRQLRNDDIVEYLNDSDVGDFIPSDEDLSDVEYTIPSPEDIESESSESEPETDNNSQINRNRSATRRGRRGHGSIRIRGGQPRSRGEQSNESIRRSTAQTSNWTAKSFSPKPLHMTEPAYLIQDPGNFEGKFSYFKQYIDDDLINMIVEKTNQTHVKNTGRSLDLSVRECQVYIGITFVMASLNYPSLRMYWEKKWRVHVIGDAMPRNRFIMIRNSLKIIFDDDIVPEVRQKDKLWKVRPLIEKVQHGCRSQMKNQSISIDEMVIPFTGSCGIKQYCPGKPNPVGLKAFVLANPDGMVLDFHIYEGNTTYPQYEGTQFGLGEKAVLTLADPLVPGHTLYFDRYFTSERLVDELKKKGIGCSGTLMKNRIPGPVRSLLEEDKILKRKGRGSSHVVVRGNNECAVTKWYDNKPVIFLSTVEAVEDSDVCQRWCKQLKIYVTVNRPQVVREYNKNMGGVDLADRLLAVCPNRYRTKKWTHRFISHMLDMSVCNAWLQYKKDKNEINTPKRKIDQLRAYKIELGEALIEGKIHSTGGVSESDNEDLHHPSSPPENTGRKRGKPVVSLPSKQKRLHHAKHMPNFSTQGRCRKCHMNKTYFACTTCKVRLCLTKLRNYFADFHNEHDQ